MTKYGYARVSTLGQELNNQLEQIKANGVNLSNIYAEKYTGKSKDRVQLNQLLIKIKDGDIVYITKIDRLARSITDLKQLIDQFKALGVTVTFINDSLTFSPNTNNANANLMLNMLGSFAEFERDLITSRMQEGKVYAKKNKANYTEGRPRRQLNKRHLTAIKLLQDNSYREVESMTEFSKSTLQRIKKQYDEEIAEGKRLAQ